MFSNKQSEMWQHTKIDQYDMIDLAIQQIRSPVKARSSYWSSNKTNYTSNQFFFFHINNYTTDNIIGVLSCTFLFSFLVINDRSMFQVTWFLVLLTYVLNSHATQPSNNQLKYMNEIICRSFIAVGSGKNWLVQSILMEKVNQGSHEKGKTLFGIALFSCMVDIFHAQINRAEK